MTHYRRNLYGTLTVRASLAPATTGEIVIAIGERGDSLYLTREEAQQLIANLLTVLEQEQANAKT